MFFDQEETGNPTLFQQLDILREEMHFLDMLVNTIGKEKLNSGELIFLIPVIAELVKIRAQSEKIIQNTNMDTSQLNMYLFKLKQRERKIG